MKDLSRICFIVQARVNSSRLPEKMIKPFGGSSLAEIAINKIKRSVFPDENFYLSVRDQELIDMADQNNIKYYLRGENSVRNDDEVPFTLPEVFEWWNKLDYDYYVLMNACNPLVRIETINNFVEDFVHSPADGLFSVIEHKRFFYRSDGTIFQEFKGSQEAKITFNTKYVEPIYSGGPLRAGKMSDVGNHIYMGDFSKPNGVPMFYYSPDEYIDIDYQYEFDIAEALYTKKQKMGENI